VVFKTKPECVTKPKAYGNMIPIKDLGTRSPVRLAWRRPVQTLAELLALAPGQDPVRGAAVRARDDLISWLRPENVALSGPPLSESDDIESWIEGIVTKWEKLR
jgi:hypothetical protein